MAADGFTYERRSVEEWFRLRGPVSMVTGAPLPHPGLVPNHSVRALIRARHPAVELAPWRS